VAYHVLGIPGLFQTFGSNIVIRDENGVIVQVPEPSVLALLVIGLAGLGFSRRKQ
jgi:hypothetical protein